MHILAGLLLLALPGSVSGAHTPLDTPDAAARAAARPPVARVEVVRDTYFGVSVPDPYRWMEAPEGDELTNFLRAQNEYARSVLDRLPMREALLNRILELQNGGPRIRFVQQAGAHFYFLETPANSTAARLVQRRIDGGPVRVLVEPARFDGKAGKASIDFLSVAPDGRHVAFVVSHAGAENWTLRFVDTASAKLLDDAVPMIASPMPSWRADGGGFYYSRLQDLPPGAPTTQRYDNVRVYLHVLGTDVKRDTPVFGPGVAPELELSGTSMFPDVIASPDGRYLVATVVRGTDSAKAVWIRDAQDRTAKWRAVAGHDDLISAVLPHDGAVYVISSRHAPNGEVLRFDAAEETIADAETILPESDVILSADNGWFGMARDALYVLGQRHGHAVILRVAREKPEANELALPAKGVIFEFTTDPDRPGVCFGLQSPTRSLQMLCHDPARNRIANTGLIDPDPADYSAVEVRYVDVPSSDGVRVPLTIVGPRDLELDGTHPVLLTVYGSYGAIVPMWFVAPNLAWYERGGLTVFAHTRGGGEKGMMWHEAGRKTRKQNTVDDTIAAANWLIREGYTSPRHLAIAGKSAGGLPVGAAITQRPDLFRAALVRVGVTDMLRIEQSSGGPGNTEEYGSVYVENEFRALHTISPYANVRDGVNYPAVMLETGVNDPRVPPWQLAKMTARLQAATASNLPVLLRVDFAAGHGLGNDKRQTAELLADEYAFLGWQLGLPGFQPAVPR